MTDEKLNYYKKKLLNEKEKVYDLLKQLERNGTCNFNIEVASEISLYDNHPGDSASEIFEEEKGLALKNNEISILAGINDALQRIDEKSYGKCVLCHKDINEKRLEFIPYTRYCVDCKNDLNKRLDLDKDFRPAEEAVIQNPFVKNEDYSIRNTYDVSEAYKIVDDYNKINMIDYSEDDDEGIDYVEDIEKISNQQYKSTLPD